jgi:peptidoglycan/xylan/chitin deacetylase (PgdA/CDA1 family)
MVLFALVGVTVAACAIYGALRSCQEPQAATSIDELRLSQDQQATQPKGSPSAGPESSNPRPARSVPPVLLKRGEGTRKVVAIAFQLRAAPGAPGGVDRQLLDALRTDEATATFFMAGLWAQAHADVAAQLARMPQIEIGDGGYSAEYLRRLPADVIRTRTRLAQDAIRSATGVTPKVYRDAEVAYDTKSIYAISSLGLKPVSGDIDLTKVRPGTSEVAMSQSVLTRVRPGSIVVLPGDGSDPRAARVFVRLLGGLARQGYTLVTVSDLAR